MDPYVKLARQTLAAYLSEREIIKPSKDLPAEILQGRAGVFVSLHKRRGHGLRGCIGTFLPTEKNIATEIIRNAIAAATQDPRFEPVELEELADLEINVDVLTEPKLVKDLEEDLNPRKYGVIVRTRDGRAGLLLPDLEGVNSVRQQLEIACQKGDIYPDEEFAVYRFEVERHRELKD